MFNIISSLLENCLVNFLLKFRLPYDSIYTYYLCRFVPPNVMSEYELNLPDYGYGSDQIVLLVDSIERQASNTIINNNNGESVCTTPSTTVVNDINMSSEKSINNNKEEKDGEIVVLFVTASSKDEAIKISNGLLEKDLVACVNLIPQVTSIYKWKGKVEQSEEVLMMIKVCYVWYAL